MTLDEYKAYSEVFGEDLYDEISLAACVAKRVSAGGAAPANIPVQLKYLRGVIDD